MSRSGGARTDASVHAGATAGVHAGLNPAGDVGLAGAAVAERFLRQGVLPRFGDYELESEIARGGMGVVYRARQKSLDRVVAVKLILAGQLATPESVQRFRLEAQAAARLQHPGIVPIYEIGECETQHYFSMELIEGASLAECLGEFRLEAGGSPSERRSEHRQQELCVAELMARVARALDFAHQRGVLHRDLKPSNILIDEQGHPHLTDFGLAKLTHRGLGGTAGAGAGPGGLTATTAVLGTPGYLAPEQAAGGEGGEGEVTTAADVYGLGATLYELLTGRPPFVASTALATMMMAVQCPPTPPRQINPAVHPDLETIALKCLEKAPEKRYHSAASVADELERFLRGEPIEARPVSRAEHAWRWCRRNPLAAGSLAAVFVVFVAAFVLVSRSYLKTQAAWKEEAHQRQEAEHREKAERWERYRSNLTAAGGALQVHNVAAARDALESAPPELRNWEWRHFMPRLDTADCALRGAAQAGHVQLSDDGGTAVVFGPSGPPECLDVRSRKAPRLLAIDFPTSSEQLSRDGKSLVLIRADNTMLVWDVAADQKRATLEGTGHAGHAPRPAQAGESAWDVLEPRFSPDGTRLAAVCTDRTVRVWDSATGKELFVLRGHGDVPGGAVFSPDGRRLASVGRGDRTVRLWDLAGVYPPTFLTGHEQLVTAVYFSPRGDRLAVCEAAPGNNLISVWEVDSGKCLCTLRGLGSDLLSLAFSPDGTRIATGSYEQSVVLWDAETGRRLATLQGHKGWVMSVAFSPDGRRLASASQDHTLRLWDVSGSEPSADKPLAILDGHTAAVTALHYADDGAALVSGSDDGTVRLWDARRAERGGVLTGHERGLYGVAFHPDGRRVASASWDGTARIWDADTGRPLAVLRYPEPNLVASVAFHPAGKLLASVGRDDCVRLWDVDSGRQVGSLPLPTEKVHEVRLAFSPRGDLLACGGGDHAVHLWAIDPTDPGGGPSVRATEVAILRGHQADVNDVAFSPDGTWLASADVAKDPTIHVWDLGRKQQAHLLKGHAEGVLALAVSRDGKWLASGSSDGTARLWDTATWQPAAVLTQGSAVYGLAFTPDGTRLACACANNSIRLWDVATREAVCDLQGHDGYVHSVAFSPDGTRLVSGSGDHTLRVWDTLSPARRAAGGPPREKR